MERKKTVKLRLKSIFRYNLNYDFLLETTKQANWLIFNAYNFIRAYILNKYNNGKPIPHVTKDFASKVFRVITKKSVGPKSKRNKELIEDLENFFTNNYVHILHPNINITKDSNMNDLKINGKNLSYIFAVAAEEISINYVNNIQRNFGKYLFQFIKNVFWSKQKIDYENCSTKERKDIREKITIIRNDILNNTENSSEKKFIKEIKEDAFPDNNKISFLDGIRVNPFGYLSSMLKMNAKLESLEKKMFQALPIRKSLKDKFITINTHALIDILPKKIIKKKGEKLKMVSKIQEEIWNNFFNLEKIKRKNYTFNHQIQTDGLSVCLNLIHVDDVANKRLRIKRRTDASKLKKLENKEKTDKEIQLENKIKEINRKTEKLKSRKKFKENVKKERTRRKKLSKEEQEKIKLSEKLKNSEFNYVGDIIKNLDMLEQLKKDKRDGNLVYVDPGKRSLMYMKRMHIDGKEDVFFNYTNKTRLKETKRLKYQKLRENRKKKEKLISLKGSERCLSKLEKRLSKTSHKSLNEEKFAKYLKQKLHLKYQIQGSEYEKYLKKLTFFTYINTKRHEDKLSSKLKKTFGENARLIIGDWSNKGRLSFISTPNLGMKRHLKKTFKINLIDEYCTSKLNYKTLDEQGNLKLLFEGRMRELHSVRTYQMSNGLLGCINRDKNAVFNMEAITNTLIGSGKRPVEFSRKSVNKNLTTVSKSNLNKKASHKKQTKQLSILVKCQRAVLKEILNAVHIGKTKNTKQQTSQTKYN